MGFVLTVSEAEGRLNSQDNLINKLEVREIKHNSGNPYGRSGRGVEAQAAAASLAKILPRKEVAAITGYSERHVTLLSNGGTNHYDHTKKGSQELKELTDSKVKEIRDEAVTKLMLAMGMIKEDNLSKCGAVDLSAVADRMSKIVERTLPKEQSSNNINLVVYAPQQKSLKDFEVVEV